jgi:hypothetical protein
MWTRKLAAMAALMLVIGGCSSMREGQQLAQVGVYADAAQNDTTRGAKDSLTTSGLPQ